MAESDALADAISSDDPIRVREVLADGFNLAKSDREKRYLYDAARCRENAREICEVLFSAGMDANKHKDSLCSLLSVGVDAEIIQQLLAAGADPNMETPGGRPLQYATRIGRVDLIDVLLRHGADPKLGSYVSDPVSDAITNNHLDCLAKLMQAGAAIPDSTENPHFYGDVVFEGCTELIRVLLDAGLDPNRRVRVGKSRARREEIHVGAWAGQRSKYPLKLLFQNAPLVHVASGRNHADLVELLIERGADPLAVDDDGHNALQIARRAKAGDALQVLIDHYGDVEPELSPEHRLLLAVADNDLEATRKLLDAGVDPNTIDWREPTKGFRPLMFAATMGNLEMIDLLLAVGAEIDCTDASDEASKPKNLAYLYSLGGIDAVGDVPLNRTALMYSTARLQIDAARRLIDLGANVNHADWVNETPLLLAMAYSDQIAQSLIDAGADVTVRDSDRCTPLHLAMYGARVHTIEKIIAAGCKVDLKNNEGNTALMMAVDNEKPQFVQVLIDAGANPTLTNREKESALLMAKRNKKILAILESSPKAKKKAGKKKATKKTTAKTKKSKPAWQSDRSIDVDRYDHHATHERLRAAATKEFFLRATKKLEELTGVDSVEISDPPIGRMVHLHQDSKITIDELQKALHPLGVFAFLFSDQGKSFTVVILPTTDPYDAPAALATNGVNCGVMTEDIIRFFKLLEQRYAFHFTGFQPDVVQGQFDTNIDSPTELAKSFCEFCPDIVDQGCGSVAALAKLLRKRNAKFFFWWD